MGGLSLVLYGFFVVCFEFSEICLFYFLVLKAQRSRLTADEDDGHGYGHVDRFDDIPNLVFLDHASSSVSQLGSLY